MKQVIKDIRTIANKANNDYSEGLNAAADLVEGHIKYNTVTIIDDMGKTHNVIKL